MEIKKNVVDLSKYFKKVFQFVENINRIVFLRLGDLNIFFYIIVKLTFLFAIVRLKSPGGNKPITPTILHFEVFFPWNLLYLYLNFLAAGFKAPEKYKKTDFPRTAERRPLPENWAMRGFIWANPVKVVFLREYFAVAESMEEDKRIFKTPSMGEQRRKKYLYFAYQIAQIRTLGNTDKKGEGRWITYNSDTKIFLPAAKYVLDFEIRPLKTKLANINLRQKANMEYFLAKEKIKNLL